MQKTKKMDENKKFNENFSELRTFVFSHLPQKKKEKGENLFLIY